MKVVVIGGGLGSKLFAKLRERGHETTQYYFDLGDTNGTSA